MSKPATSFPSHAHMTIIRQESQLRKTALSSFGPQGVLDLALLGAILGNNIREIGRYRITCDGQLVQGRYTIYELVHFGVLSVTGRQSSRSRRQHRRGETMGSRSSTESTHSSDSTSTTKSKSALSQRIYPAMLANLFPQLVFKALRKKSIRPPKFQHDDSACSPTFPSVFTCDDIPEDRALVSTPAPLETQTSSSSSPCSDPMLITSEKVLADLIQKRLHRVKDLPLPRELCFLGAVSLPMPSVLRPMHVAWTMDFLNTRATTVRRQHQQQAKKPNATTGSSTGGLDFRSDIYAHKMRLARLARAQQQQRRAAARSAMGEDHSTASASSIPEENEDEVAEEQDEKKKQLQPQDVPSAVPAAAATTAATTNNNAMSNKDRSVRQDRRLMQQLLTLESKVPRLVRQWSTAARSCFSEELNQEDRQVQDWVDRQRIQVVLGSGYRFGHSGSNTNSPTSSSFPCPSSSSSNNPLSTATPGTNNPLSMSMSMAKSKCLSSSRPRPILKPIATTLANAAYTHSNHGRYASSPMFGTPRTPPAPAVGAVVPSPTRLSHSLPLSGTTTTNTRMCFSEGIRLGSSPARGGVAIAVNNTLPGHMAVSSAATAGGTGGEDLTMARSRPPSGGGLQDRLSVSQQMLSMHLWLSLLVSPISPEHMIQDQFSFMDSQL